MCNSEFYCLVTLNCNAQYAQRKMLIEIKKKKKKIPKHSQTIQKFTQIIGIIGQTEL